MQTLTKRVRQLEEDFEQTETRLHAANEKFSEASKAADESERSVCSSLLDRYTYLYVLIQRVFSPSGAEDFRGVQTVGPGVSKKPEIYLGVKHGILIPIFFGNKYFLVHRSLDSQQNH